MKTIKFKISLLALTVILLSSLILGACSAPEPTPTPTATPTTAPAPAPTTSPTSAPAPWDESIRFLGASVGSSTFMMITYLSKELGDELGIPVGAFPGSADKNLLLLNQGKAELSYAMADGAYGAYNGVAPKYTEAQSNLRFICHYNTVFVAFFVRADSKITNMEDIVGKRLSLSTKGSAADVNGRAVLDAGYGITPDTIEATGGIVSYVSYNDMANNLLDGTTDVICMLITGEEVKSQVIAIEERYGVRLLKYGEKIDEIIAQYPFFSKVEVQGGVYKNEPNPVPLVGLASIIVAHNKLPEDLVYTITSCLLSDKTHEELVLRDPSRKHFTLENGLIGATIPLHTGAAKFYTEKGMAIPAGAEPIK